MPVLFVVLDGVGDEPIPDLGDRTPLEAAATPALDAFTVEGALGLTTTVGEGIAPESDIAVMALLGYDPGRHHPGRGPVEAAGVGMELADGDLAWRGNFATVDTWPHLADRRAGRDLTSGEAASLAAEVNDGVKLEGASFELRSTVGHRAALVLHDEQGPLAPVTNTDPAYRRQGSLGVALETFPWEVQEARPDPGEESGQPARRAAELTNDFTRQSHAVLEAAEVNRRRRDRGSLPANAVLLRDAGTRPKDVEPIGDRFGARFGCFVEMPVEAGISRLVGMDEIDAPVDADDPEGQYRAWAERALEALGTYDVLYIHIKGPDVPAHDGDFIAKRDIIALIDRAFFAPLREHLEGARLLVTADHATSSLRKAHTDAPVPYLLWGGDQRDATSAFSERAAAGGSLPHRAGNQLMGLALGTG